MEVSMSIEYPGLIGMIIRDGDNTIVLGERQIANMEKLIADARTKADEYHQQNVARKSGYK